MKGHLIVLRGIPASGKSSLASAMLQAGLVDVIVTRDDLRQELQPGRKFIERDQMTLEDREFEHRVLMERNHRITEALRTGQRVVSADTNVSRTALRDLRSIASQVDANISVITLDVPVELCIERDAARVTPVGEDVILRMSFDWLQVEKG